jgi:hypothetical protein
MWRTAKVEMVFSFSAHQFHCLHGFVRPKLGANSKGDFGTPQAFVLPVHLSSTTTVNLQLQKFEVELISSTSYRRDAFSRRRRRGDLSGGLFCRLSWQVRYFRWERF